MRKLSMVVPSIPQDVDVLLHNLDFYFCFLPISSLVIIGPDNMKSFFPNDKRIEFINENDLINKVAVKEIIDKRLLGEDVKRDRTGWYVQQFIKMSYSRICADDYYLLWDSDTVPVKKLDLFDEKGRPFFDLKNEFHKPYFDTISMLFPELKRGANGSFISEHMLINTQYMREMIAEVENNNKLRGVDFSEKIINAIDIESLQTSGFSEFETFGTYVQSRYPGTYNLRHWQSLRFGKFFFHYDSLRKNDMEWLSKNYDAITFEKVHDLSKVSVIVNTNLFKTIFPSSLLEYLAMSVRLKRKVFHNTD